MSVSFGALAFGTPVSIGWSVVLVPLPLVSGISLRRDATTRVCASCVCDFGQPCASTGGLDGRHRFYRVQSVQPVCAPVCVRVLRGEGGSRGATTVAAATSLVRNRASGIRTLCSPLRLSQPEERAKKKSRQ